VGGGGNPNLDCESTLGLPNNFGEAGFPTIGGMNTFQFGGTMYQYQENQIISNIDENLTKTLRKHQMQFGGPCQRVWVRSRKDPQMYGDQR
jgi:hypothetical protein